MFKGVGLYNSRANMYFLQRLFLLVAIVTTVISFSGFPDKTIVWTSDGSEFFYSSEVEGWTNAKISSTEFGKTITSQEMGDLDSVKCIAVDNPAKHMILAGKQGAFMPIVIVGLNEAFSTWFHLGTSKDVGQLAIDWLGRNVYWADTGYGWIAMKNLPYSANQHNSFDTDFRVAVDQNLERPKGITVHPKRFFLFWTDVGSTSKIERSDLIGGNRRVIIWQSLITPTTLCIDQSADRLYWTDPGRGTIEYADFDGNDRRVLLSDPDIAYYGIAVFRDSLIYTAPSHNRTGFVSLKENNEGEHVQASLNLDLTFNQVVVYATELQESQPDRDMCASEQGCDHMCLYMKDDAGYTCLCDDGYELMSETQCVADGKVLERHLLFTNENEICAVTLSILSNIPSRLPIHCDIVTGDTNITRFAVDMTEKVVFYTNGTVIYKQGAFKEDKTILHSTDSTIIDMDYNWKTQKLYWVESGNGNLYHIDVNDVDSQPIVTKTLSNEDVTNLAVDPHNRKVFWIVKKSEDYSLNVWDIGSDNTQQIQTSLLVKPTDLEYDRANDRLLWLDNEGHVGMINTDGTHERKYKIRSTGQSRHAISAYKNLIFTSTAEISRQFDLVYEIEQETYHVTLHDAFNGPVLDLHIYDTSLQPSDHEPCEVDNGGCEHICLPGNEQKCACVFGYTLMADGRSCQTVVLDSNYFITLDTVHGNLYQLETNTWNPHIIDIDVSNRPTKLAFDPTRNDVIWVDSEKQAVKIMKIGSQDERAVLSGIASDTVIAVDVSSGNIYIATQKEIKVVSPDGDKHTVVPNNQIKGTVGNIAVMPQSGLMSWYEIGDSPRLVVANMDGSNARPDNVDMDEPRDIVFDPSNERNLFWCDSGLDKIERVDTVSLASTLVYTGHGLKPIAIDIVGDILYFVPEKQRELRQINKNTGQGQTVVFKSPLFGSLDNFFFAKAIDGHALCSTCNGGCSTLCLPSGVNKRCACADGTSLKDDETSCQYVNVCPASTYTSKSGLQSLTGCCPSSPNAVCKPECEAGYQVTAAVVACKSSKWNVSLEGVCKASESSPLPIAYIGAGAGGGVALIAVAIVICVCWRRKLQKERYASKYASSGSRRGLIKEYDYATGSLSPGPPSHEPDPEVYDTIKDDEMLGTRDEISGNNGDGYLTVSDYSRTKEPKPDYGVSRYPVSDDVGGEGADGYLRSNSVGSGSVQGDSGGSISKMSYDDSFDHTRIYHPSMNRDMSAVKYSAQRRGKPWDGQISIVNQHGYDSRHKSPGIRDPERNVSDGNASHLSLTGSYGHSGHI